jgi:hypothetical protein
MNELLIAGVFSDSNNNMSAFITRKVLFHLPISLSSPASISEILLHR